MGVNVAFRGRGADMWILDYVVGLARSIAARSGVRYVTLDALGPDSLVAWRAGRGPSRLPMRLTYPYSQSQTLDTARSALRP